MKCRPQRVRLAGAGCEPVACQRSAWMSGEGMVQVAIVVVGVCLGVLTAQSSVPRIRWVTFVSAGVLVVVAVVAQLVYTHTGFLGGLLFLVAALAASALYSGRMWRRSGLDPEVSYWGWVWRDFAHPRYLRHIYAVADRESDQDVVPR